MSLPDPVPGLVIRYSFLWSHEAARGEREGSKARPCAIIVSAMQEDSGKIRVTVAPITHAPPSEQSLCLPVPSGVARSLDLDSDPQWFRFDEINHFEWPGFDLRPLPDRPGEVTYGLLPKPLFEKIRDQIFENARNRKLKSLINRDE